ncbi:hypothetical protein [Methylophaga sp.]|uniref:hypothetical protein n=1 Tax=Methylophaga sp. TaxID=2024840 RepID=UPI003A912B21
MAILRSLLVNMGLNSSQYRTELTKTQKQTKTSFAEMSKSVAGYASAGAAALSASVVATSTMVRNQQNMARISNMTVQEYNAMSFAAGQYGLTAESIANVSKDAIEKVGEYINTGGGGLQDFADAMNMTKQETLEWARSVQGMSGIDIFKKMIAEMEAAELSAGQMSNALESLGSDTTNLIPLFENNGKEVERLTGKYKEFNQELSPEQVANYRKTAENIDLMTVSIKQMTATALEPAIKEVYEFMKTWETMGDRRASYGLRTEIDALAKESRELREKINAGTGWFYDEDDLAEDKERLDAILVEYNQKTDELRKLREKNQPTFGDLYGGQDEIIFPSTKSIHKTAFETDNNKAQTWGDIYGGTDSVDTYLLNLSKQQDAEAQALADSLKLSTETLEEKYERENAILEQGLSDHQEYLEAKKMLDDEYAEAQREATEKAAQFQYQNSMDLLSYTSNMFGITTDMLESAGKEQTAVYKALFLAQKAAAIPSMIVATEEAATKALTMGPVAGPILAASTKALGYASIGVVAGQAIAGVAHGGIDEIPGYGKDQTWLLQGGERVVSKEQNQDLKNYMKNGNQPAAGGNVTIQVMGNIYGDEQTEKIMSDAAQRGYKMMYDDARSNGPVSNQIRR